MGLTLNPAGAELLDRPDANPGLVRQSLQNIARANRWFGGSWAVRWGVGRALASLPPGTRLLLLDAGAGVGDLAGEAERTGRRHGMALTAWCVDRHREAARLAAANAHVSLQADAGDLPLPARSVDIVLLSQLLHHFSPSSAAVLLQEAARVARHSVIVADLRRSWLAALAFRFGARLLRFDAVTIEDGLTSLRRGFNRDELAAVFAAAGLQATVTRRPGWRLVALASVA